MKVKFYSKYDIKVLKVKDVVIKKKKTVRDLQMS